MTEIVLKLTSLLGLGFVLGFKHALDADHIVAISTIVSQTKNLKKSYLMGALWGVGHTTTLLLAGLVILGFKLVIPDKLALSFELLVGVVLVLLGLDLLRTVFRDKIHLHKHQHGDIVHAHIHSHKHSLSHRHTHRSLFVGMIHGLAGSAALMLLVLTTVKSVFQGLIFILVFGMGSILGMFLTSAIIGLPFVVTARFERINNGIKVAAGTLSIVLGGIIIYQISIVRGLFT